MEYGRYGMELFSAESESDLIRLIKLQEMAGAGKEIIMGQTAWFPGEDRIRELLTKVREIANKHHLTFPFSILI